MRIILQRVKEASVIVNGNITGEIKHGILLLVGFEPMDTLEDYKWIAKKVIQLRIFNDEEGIMNLDIQQTKGDLLVVSQFTLHASSKKGNRPSYIKASRPSIAIDQYEMFLQVIEEKFKPVQKGIFGADMEVKLINDGPITIFIDSKNKE